MADVDAGVTPAYDRMKEVKEFDESKVGVKGLADSGITSIPRFFVHPPETISDLKKPSQACTTKSIPVIDLAHLKYSPHERQKLVAEIKEATATWGFFQVINHGVPVSVLDETINAIRAFHDQPQEVRAKHYKRQESHGVMYATNNDLYRAKAATWHDSLGVWLSPEKVRAKEEEIPEICRKEVLAWESHATKVAEALFELLSEGLGVEAGRFKELGFLAGKLLVGHCYPYCPRPDLTVGITSHTDSGLTVLLQNQVAGLQVKHGDEWVNVKPIPGALTINIGDFIQIISNDNYTSVEHRVLANPCKDPRISVVIFFNVGNRGDSEYFGPLEELVSAEKPRLYRKFTVQEFHKNFLGKGLDSKSIIEQFKLPREAEKSA
ncbi:hypothetical protein F2P56_022212 [Juglans regia]|uniref:Fe2OG dioxygenase domain-containing protein n=2 Tax=Juglans regia TaxID=51240 RepID=A0A833UJX7_JUGRE|nr:1-aminocyclopropane-1-carboxylate oxidase homolog 4-like [Juglans regia]KAF5458157.1 hypothetical protein F2P56_022212 [Juglans regia]